MTYRDLYPTGRKHCSRCKRWRHLIDFGVEKWFDIERTIPRVMKSACTICETQRNRERNGHAPRPIGPAKFSPAWYEARRRRSRESLARRWRDPAYRADRNEYMRIWREANDKQPRSRPSRSAYEDYPTGRKHCKSCGSWRLLVDFSVAQWLDDDETIPGYMRSQCHVCRSRHEKARKLEAKKRRYTRSQHVDALPVITWIDRDPERLSNVSENAQHKIVIARAAGTIPIHIVDEIVTANGAPHLLDALAPSVSEAV